LVARRRSETNETREEGKPSNMLTILDIRARKHLHLAITIFNC
jgi:hypothetical protein